jgi:hypothetical protein
VKIVEILKFSFTEEEFILECCKNITSSKNTLADDIYYTLTSFISPTFSNIPNINEIKHKYTNNYYDKFLSLKEYIENDSLLLYYTNFTMYSSKDTIIIFDKIELPSFIKLKPINYGYDAIKYIKVKNVKLKTKNKINVEILELDFNKDILTKILNSLLKLNKEILLPSHLGVWEWRQTFYNKISGETYFCNCFKKAITKTKEELFISNTHQHIKKALENNSFKNSICHICKNTNSNLIYCSKMYGSEVKVRYGAYIKKLEIEKEISERDAENEIRQIKNIAKIGEKWINETILFNYINILFPEYNVIRESSPEWIGKQRLDIFIPELSLAIEYQGEQHFKEVSIFGGKEGLKKAKERDAIKKIKCKENKVTLIYFTYKENLSESLVIKKLNTFLKDKTNA